MRLPRALQSIIPALVLAACGTSFNAGTGGDGGRGDATELQLGALLWDRVDAEAGDHTDWKRLELEAPARLRIRAFTFEPRGFKGVLELRDERGQVVATLPLTDRVQDLATDALDGGAWFVQVAASEGAADYGLEVTLAAGKAQKRGPVID